MRSALSLMFLLCRHNSGFNHPCTPFCTLYYALCLQPHYVYKSYPSDLFPTGLAEIIGQSSIYVEHLPPPPSFDAAFFLREWWYWSCAFFLFFSRKTDVDCSGLWRLPGEIGQRERLLEAGGSQGEIMQNLVQTYAFEEIARGAVIFFGGEKRKNSWIFFKKNWFEWGWVWSTLAWKRIEVSGITGAKTFLIQSMCGSRIEICHDHHNRQSRQFFLPA